MMTTSDMLLDVRGLSVEFGRGASAMTVVDGVDFTARQESTLL